jgi:ribosomal protein S17E
MGRIKTSFIKNIGRDLFERHPEMFFADFQKNKKIVESMLFVKSKKMKNIITGYMTSLKRHSLRESES